MVASQPFAGNDEQASRHVNCDLLLRPAKGQPVIKRVSIGLAALLILVSLVGFIWVRSVFGHDAVRIALAAQISSAVGQPVTIDSISAGLYPRVTVNLGGVSIGQPPRIRAQTLRLGTDFRALLSRTIEHGSIRVDGARVELPLPPLGTNGESAAAGESSWPVTIASIDEVVLNGVEIVSGGRTLGGRVEAVPHEHGVTLRQIALTAEDTSIEGTGEISDLSGPVGEIAIKSDRLNLTRLLLFLSEFSSGSGLTAGASGSSKPARSVEEAATPGPNLVVSLDAGRASLGTLALERLGGRARLTRAGLTVDPIEFGVFGGRYQGTLGMAQAGTPTFQVKALLSDIDVPAATAHAGIPDTITGRLSGRIDLSAQGIDSANVLDSARGTIRVDVKDGVVRNLGLLESVVVATSMRGDAKLQMPASSDEPFSALGATLTVANGSAHTTDLRLESPDLTLLAAGSLALDGSAIALKGTVQLSDALSQQAGRDLLRYTQDRGRVTLPAVVTGSARSPSVQIDMASLLERAVKNKLNEEATKAIKRGLDRLFK
jgi:uncharacterized protein involved in outer membrane biogenesis